MEMAAGFIQFPAQGGRGSRAVPVDVLPRCSTGLWALPVPAPRTPGPLAAATILKTNGKLRIFIINQAVQSNSVTSGDWGCAQQGQWQHWKPPKKISGEPLVFREKSPRHWQARSKFSHSYFTFFNKEKQSNWLKTNTSWKQFSFWSQESDPGPEQQLWPSTEQSRPWARTSWVEFRNADFQLCCWAEPQWQSQGQTFTLFCFPLSIKINLL